MTSLKPKPPVGSWRWELDVEQRSLDRLLGMLERRRLEEERMRRGIARKRWLATLGVPLEITAEEHALIERDFRRRAASEPDPTKAAELRSLANLAANLAKAKPPARKRRRTKRS